MKKEKIEIKKVKRFKKSSVFFPIFGGVVLVGGAAAGVTLGLMNLPVVTAEGGEVVIDPATHTGSLDFDIKEQVDDKVTAKIVQAETNDGNMPTIVFNNSEETEMELTVEGGKVHTEYKLLNAPTTAGKYKYAFTMQFEYYSKHQKVVRPVNNLFVEYEISEDVVTVSDDGVDKKPLDLQLDKNGYGTATWKGFTYVGDFEPYQLTVKNTFAMQGGETTFTTKIVQLDTDKKTFDVEVDIAKGYSNNKPVYGLLQFIFNGKTQELEHQYELNLIETDTITEPEYEDDRTDELKFDGDLDETGFVDYIGFYNFSFTGFDGEIDNDKVVPLVTLTTGETGIDFYDESEERYPYISQSGDKTFDLYVPIIVTNKDVYKTSQTVIVNVSFISIDTGEIFGGDSAYYINLVEQDRIYCPNPSSPDVPKEVKLHFDPNAVYGATGHVTFKNFSYAGFNDPAGEKEDVVDISAIDYVYFVETVAGGPINYYLGNITNIDRKSKTFDVVLHFASEATYDYQGTTLIGHDDYNRNLVGHFVFGYWNWWWESHTEVDYDSQEYSLAIHSEDRIVPPEAETGRSETQYQQGGNSSINSGSVVKNATISFPFVGLEKIDPAQIANEVTVKARVGSSLVFDYSPYVDVINPRIVPTSIVFPEEGKVEYGHFDIIFDARFDTTMIYPVSGLWTDEYVPVYFSFEKNGTPITTDQASILHYIHYELTEEPAITDPTTKLGTINHIASEPNPYGAGYVASCEITISQFGYTGFSSEDLEDALLFRGATVSSFKYKANEENAEPIDINASFTSSDIAIHPSGYSSGSFDLTLHFSLIIDDLIKLDDASITGQISFLFEESVIKGFNFTIPAGEIHAPDQTSTEVTIDPASGTGTTTVWYYWYHLVNPVACLENKHLVGEVQDVKIRGGATIDKSAIQIGNTVPLLGWDIEGYFHIPFTVNGNVAGVDDGVTLDCTFNIKDSGNGQILKTEGLTMSFVVHEQAGPQIFDPSVLVATDTQWTEEGEATFTLEGFHISGITEATKDNVSILKNQIAFNPEGIPGSATIDDAQIINWTSDYTGFDVVIKLKNATTIDTDWDGTFSIPFALGASSTPFHTTSNVALHIEKAIEGPYIFVPDNLEGSTNKWVTPPSENDDAVVGTIAKITIPGFKFINIDDIKKIKVDPIVKTGYYTYAFEAVASETNATEFSLEVTILRDKFINITEDADTTHTIQFKLNGETPIATDKSTVTIKTVANDGMIVNDNGVDRDVTVNIDSGAGFVKVEYTGYNIQLPGSLIPTLGPIGITEKPEGWPDWLNYNEAVYELQQDEYGNWIFAMSCTVQGGPPATTGKITLDLGGFFIGDNALPIPEEMLHKEYYVTIVVN